MTCLCMNLLLSLCIHLLSLMMSFPHKKGVVRKMSGLEHYAEKNNITCNYYYY